MKRIFYKRRFIFVPLIAIAALTITGFVVQNLWNALLPGILHVGIITFWQALGIFVLCKILFGFGRGGGGFGGGRRKQEWVRQKMQHKMQNMTPEERERFKAQMKERMCGPRGRGWKTYDWGDDKPAAETQNPQ
ncbi:hypothetical protein [Mucilaginibacter ginkgonis]|uniref:Uncharacterized protein n=1 Tax=Mucilaginibacter ginkgonis TaxID=2682091 RepID=A0A6I4ING6_9SPHI|nr:hypothetical protein [Mucilaginibacter ginkgonis]QQL48565.1 hypothetical protein GO620_010260 [Mucilaginibacter ginkgonis]